MVARHTLVMYDGKPHRKKVTYLFLERLNASFFSSLKK